MRDQLDLSFIPRKHLTLPYSENPLFACSGLSLFFPAVASSGQKLCPMEASKTALLGYPVKANAVASLSLLGALHLNNTKDFFTEVPLSYKKRPGCWTIKRKEHSLHYSVKFPENL